MIVFRNTLLICPTVINIDDAGENLPAAAALVRVAPVQAPAAPVHAPAAPAQAPADALDDFRRVRAAQDAEYAAGLAADRARQQERQRAQQEERERAIAEDRRREALAEALAARRAEAVAHLDALGEVGPDGYHVAFVLPSGRRLLRRFAANSPISLLRTAVEAHEEAPWGFRLRTATTNEQVEEYEVTVRDFFGEARRILLRVEVDEDAPHPADEVPPNPIQPVQVVPVVEVEPQPQPVEPLAAAAGPDEPEEEPRDGLRPPYACSICWGERAEVVAVPCGHLSMCRGCARTVERGNRECCICRRGIDIFQRVYN